MAGEEKPNNFQIINVIQILPVIKTGLSNIRHLYEIHKFCSLFYSAIILRVLKFVIQNICLVHCYTCEISKQDNQRDDNSNLLFPFFPSLKKTLALQLLQTIQDTTHDKQVYRVFSHLLVCCWAQNIITRPRSCSLMATRPILLLWSTTTDKSTPHPSQCLIKGSCMT